jgi:hypothetical protein
MTDLRTRIAAALERADKEPQPFDQGPVGYEYLADAVIRGLGLEVESGGTYEVGGKATSYRYVTDWKPSDG